MFGFGTITNTTINADGHSVSFSTNSLSPMGCCNSIGNFTPGCFGYGFSPMCGNSFGFGLGGNNFSYGVGTGLGFAAGMALVPALPKVFDAIGAGASWAWNKAILPAGKAIGKAATWAWNKAIVPAAKGVWSGIKAVGKGIASAASWVGNGIKNAWNWIWGKK